MPIVLDPETQAAFNRSRQAAATPAQPITSNEVVPELKLTPAQKRAAARKKELALLKAEQAAHAATPPPRQAASTPPPRRPVGLNRIQAVPVGSAGSVRNQEKSLMGRLNKRKELLNQ